MFLLVYTTMTASFLGAWVWVSLLVTAAGLCRM